MGLYQKICDKFLNQDNIDSFNDQNCVGLLAKAEQFLSNMENIDCLKFDKPFVFFKNFASEVGLNKVAVLVPYENVYHTIFSYGIEPASREETISTCDFWDGTLTSNQWYSLADEDLSSFYQLFSYDDAQVLKHLHIKKFQIDENTYAIILILEDTLTSLIDLETIEIILPNLKEQLLPIITLINDGALFPKNEDLSEIKERINSEVAKFNTGFMHSISLKSILILGTLPLDSISKFFLKKSLLSLVVSINEIYLFKKSLYAFNFASAKEMISSEELDVGIIMLSKSPAM